MTSRRDTVRGLAGFAVLPLLRRLGVDDPREVGHRAHTLAELRRSDSAQAPRALTAAEYEIVVLAAERIIPRTKTPGATDASVADFIDVMLTDWYDSAERDRFRSGLRELDTSARSVSGKGFVEAGEKHQIDLLQRFDRQLQALRQSDVVGGDDNWFAMLKHLTVWGYYTSRVGITEELRAELLPGRFEGNAQYNGNAGY
jgi:hypothetical protein